MYKFITKICTKEQRNYRIKSTAVIKNYVTAINILLFPFRMLSLGSTLSNDQSKHSRSFMRDIFIFVCPNLYATDDFQPLWLLSKNMITVFRIKHDEEIFICLCKFQIFDRSVRGR